MLLRAHGRREAGLGADADEPAASGSGTVTFEVPTGKWPLGFATVYGSGVGRAKMVTVAGLGGVLQKNVALPEVAATYCLPATW